MKQILINNAIFVSLSVLCCSNAMATYEVEMKTESKASLESAYKPFYELGKSWIYKSWDPYLSEEDAVYTKTTVVRDTIVDNRQAFLLKTENLYQKDNPTYAIGSEENGEVCMYSEEQKKFYTVFDFGLNMNSVIDISFFNGFEETKAGSAQVTNIRNINIEKHGRKVLTLESYPDKTTKHYWIEGVGSFDDFSMRLTEKPIGYVEILLECRIGEECLYQKESSPEYGIAEFVPIVQTGKVWEYTVDNRDYYYYTIGDARKVNNITYFEFFQFKKILADERNLQASEMWNGELDRSWIRERNGIVYLLTVNNRPASEIEANCKDYSEFLLYDFNKETGDEWDYPNDINLLGETFPYFVETGHIELADKTTAKTLSLQRRDPYYDTPIMMIEGIGITNNGHLTNFKIETPENAAPTSEVPGANATLNRVFLPSGEIIYSREGVTLPPSGIDHINIDIFKDTDILFDLMGNQVLHPLPGTIYIRDGHKFIIRAK